MWEDHDQPDIAAIFAISGQAMMLLHRPATGGLAKGTGISSTIASRIRFAASKTLVYGGGGESW